MAEGELGTDHRRDGRPALPQPTGVDHFLDAATDPQSPMPAEMRKNMIGLCRFVINQCMRMLFEPDPKKLDLMIEINQHIAAGCAAVKGTDLPANGGVRPPEAAAVAS